MEITKRTAKYNRRLTKSQEVAPGGRPSCEVGKLLRWLGALESGQFCKTLTYIDSNMGIILVNLRAITGQNHK
jgi:hypothetical protein